MDAEGAKRAEVAVVGGGLAGLAVGLELARGGARVVVLEAREALGRTGSARDLGVVRLGLLDHPNRIAEAIGAERAQDLLRLGLRNEAIWRAEGLLQVQGGLWVATIPGEAEDLAASLPLLRAVGATATERTAAEVDALLGAEGLGPGLHIAEQGAIDPVEARRALAEALRAAGGELRLSWPVGAIGQESAGLRLEGPAGVLRAELVVVAAGAGAGAVQPWLRDKLWPVRAPVLRLAASPDRFPAPWVSQTGYVTGRTLPGGDVLLSGCRWASLEQGMGEEDEAAVDADMLGALRAFAGRFPDLAGAAERDRWSHVTAYSCDALPFVGPVPGRPRELCCAGFQGLDASLARVAAQAVAEGILRGRAETWPGWLSPGRMG